MSEESVVSPPLPTPRGPLSAAVAEALAGSPSSSSLPVQLAETVDPFGADLATALHSCYELHYRGFASVDDVWEWDPDLLRLRAAMERRFMSALRAEVTGGCDVAAELEALLVEHVPGAGVSHHLRDEGEWWQLREFLVHRSIYQLKEADPYAWVIPRLLGQAKAAFVAVEFDEFGAGHGDHIHSHLYAELLTRVGLSDGYLHYVDDVPAQTLAVANLMSMFGLHRSLRGALVGHFAQVEITSAPSAQRLVGALERLGTGPECTYYFSEHVEADAVHEQLLRRDVIGDLLARERYLAADVVFGVRATELLEGRLGEHLLTSWRAGQTSLLRPLPDHVGPR